LTDLALCCEYLTTDKLCSTISESEKAKAARQVHCQNDEKMACCYICSFKRNCAINCRFLGDAESKTEHVEAQKTVDEDRFIEDKKTEANQPIDAQIVCCSVCNVEMTQKKTSFKIDGLEEPNKTADEAGKLDGELLPVIIYLCPKCGKIDFKANEKLEKAR
jgi:hypothetical protein